MEINYISKNRCIGIRYLHLAPKMRKIIKKDKQVECYLFPTHCLILDYENKIDDLSEENINKLINSKEINIQRF